MALMSLAFLLQYPHDDDDDDDHDDDDNDDDFLYVFPNHPTI